jgi:hypothetical protein
MEKRILLNDVMFTSLAKKGFLMDGNIQLQLTTRELALLCQGKILEKQHIDWNGTIEYRLAMQDIGFEMINEILKRSPIFSELAGNFTNYK